MATPKLKAEASAKVELGGAGTGRREKREEEAVGQEAGGATGTVSPPTRPCTVGRVTLEHLFRGLKEDEATVAVAVLMAAGFEVPSAPGALAWSAKLVSKESFMH